MLKIDFGSGYNPKDGYKTCDITYAPNLDFVFDQQKYKIINCADNSVDEIYCRNVLHHVKDLEKLFIEFRRVLKVGGRLVIVEPAKEHFDANLAKDFLWYRFIIPRHEVWYSEEYREYISDLERIVGLCDYNGANDMYEIHSFKKE